MFETINLSLKLPCLWALSSSPNTSWSPQCVNLQFYFFPIKTRFLLDYGFKVVILNLGSAKFGHVHNLDLEMEYIYKFLK
jgi:hypothetical protein